MIRGMPAWLVSLVSILVVVAGLAWWTMSSTTAAPLTATPAASNLTSPLSSTLVDQLKQRTIYGNLPLTDASPYDHSDPFVSK